MKDVLPDLPPGLEWLDYLIGFDWEMFGWGGWIVGVLGAALLNGSFLMLGAWIERRHDRALSRMEAATAAVRVFTSRPPAGVTGRPHLVQAAIVMAPAPLGRMMVLLRRIVGGRVATRQRDMQRTRRLALLRLREQALAAGAGVLAGVEFCQIGLDRGRFAMIATGTALIGAPSAPVQVVTEAVGMEAPRHRRELVLALAILVVLAGGAAVADVLFDNYAGTYLKRYTMRRDALPPVPDSPPGP